MPLGLLMLTFLLAPPGYDRLDEGLPGLAEGLPVSEFPTVPVRLGLDPDQVASLEARLGPPTVMGGDAVNPPRRGFVFGRSDRPSIGFALWIQPDGSALARGWVVEPRLPPIREIRQAWLVPGIVSWLEAMTASD